MKTPARTILLLSVLAFLGWGALSSGVGPEVRGLPPQSGTLAGELPASLNLRCPC